MMEVIIVAALAVLLVLQIVLWKNSNRKEVLNTWDENLARLEENLHRNMKDIREDYIRQSRLLREELHNEQMLLRKEVSENLLRLIAENRHALEEGNQRMTDTMKVLQQSMERNMSHFKEMQHERFGEMEKKQQTLISSTEKHLEEMRQTVDEKLQKTLNERIARSFELVKSQLESVQTGLGEMKALAQDVGGLKRVLTNVKTRGVFGEVQLRALLDQMLSPEQYACNVKTKRGSNDLVEFAIRFPRGEEKGEVVYLPIDAKFPKDAYENYLNAQESGDLRLTEQYSKQLETTLLGMARDIHDKYIDPPYTTDFAILFLPFENIYAEVIRRTALMELMQRKYKIAVTGPTTLGAILNSLQMGFRTLAIQKRSSEVWAVLGAVKTEFGRFGDMLERVQRNIQDAGNNLDKLVGTRTKMMLSKLKSVEALPMQQVDSVFNALPDAKQEEEEQQ